MSRSPFLAIPPEEHLASNALAFAISDGFPVAEGHALVIPRRCFGSWFEATRQEREAIFDLVDEVVALLEERHRPDGFNIGVNVGEAAGQTVMHLHVHVIPRYEGDVDDPAGGVRFVIPERGNYRRPGFVPGESGRPERPRLATGGAPDPFLGHLRPLFAEAERILILVAFVQHSGVRRLRSHIEGALARGARVEILTGDYLHITQSEALGALLDLSRAQAAVRAPTDGGGEEVDDDALVGAARGRGNLTVRVVESEGLRAGALRGTTFHPKAWIFLRGEGGTAFVGSSNMSWAALTEGIEWNLRLERARDPVAFGELLEGWARLQAEAVELDERWIEAYAARMKEAPALALPPGELVGEAKRQPRDVQLEALERLRRDRQEGRTRAVVVLATGLGKTFLAALDVRQFVEERGGRVPRVLFVAHRVELLVQACEAFREEFPGARTTFFMGASGRDDGDFVFASVFKLARQLGSFQPDAFDYIVVDEVHHATARSWRAIVERFEPSFLLGLTATPERADGGDVLGLFDDHVAYEANLVVGIERGHLVPFRYFGLADTVDYAAIPWRNRSFDPTALEAAVITEARMEQIWRGWQAHPGTRTLVFCCSVRHAAHAKAWLSRKCLNDKQIRVAMVCSGEGSDDREDSLKALREGKLDAICSVDLFNEGVDVPTVDRVVMLRPTESPVLFLQQLGRGLRTAEGKKELVVLDLVGNHRVFLQRLRFLMAEGAEPGIAALRSYLEGSGPLVLPPGCSVDLELAAVNILSALLPRRAKDNALVEAYRTLRDERGERPAPAELYRMGYNPASLKRPWFDFVEEEGDLTEVERAAHALGHAWLAEIGATDANKSFKLVTLEAMIEAGALLDGLEVAELAVRCHRILVRSPELAADLPEEHRVRELAVGKVREVWVRYWRQWPLDHWAARGRKQAARGSKAWFRYDGDAERCRFVPAFRTPTAPAEREALVALSRELVDYRMARYRRRSVVQRAALAGLDDDADPHPAFICRVIHNARGPILLLPERARAPVVPGPGEIEVTLPDGERWLFRMVKIACNVAHPVGGRGNQLGALLMGWFGPQAGQPGTAFEVRFRLEQEGWAVAPLIAASSLDAGILGAVPGHESEP